LERYLWAWLLASSAGAWAQTTTGSLAGTVFDETGGVLTGVTVGLTGAHVTGTRTTVTANFGRPAGFIAPRRMVVGTKLRF
jgi:hypothetical protein